MKLSLKDVVHYKFTLISTSNLKLLLGGAKMMTQPLKACAAPPEDPSLVPKAHNGQLTPHVTAAPGNLTPSSGL